MQLRAAPASRCQHVRWPLAGFISTTTRHLWPPQPVRNGATLRQSPEQRPSLPEWHREAAMQKAPGCSHPPRCWWITHPSGRCGTAPGDVLLPKFPHRSLVLLGGSGLLAKPHGVRQVHHLFPAGEVLMEGWHEGKEGSVLSGPEGLLPWSIGGDRRIPGASQTRASHHSNASTASLSPTPGASETPWHYVCPP